MAISADTELSHELVATDELADLLLHRLWMKRAPLHAFVPGGRETQLVTTILRISKDRRFLLLDEFNLESGQMLLRQSKRLTLIGQVQGVEVRFTTQLDKIEFLDGVAVYRMLMPPQLQYRQQRKNFRVKVPTSTPLAASVDFRESGKFTSRVTDISQSGLRCLVENPHSLVLDEPEYRCQLWIPDEERIDAAVAIRHIRYAEHHRLYLGLQFIQLGAAEERQLGQLIRRFERHWLQQRSLFGTDDDDWPLL